jgi:hypothetical protein
MHVEPSFKSLFGGRTRASILEVLASSSRPMSAYRIAKVVGTETVRVSTVLRQLDGLVTRSEDGWYLSDVALRDFIRSRTFPVLRSGPPNRYLRAAVRELRRPPQKDVILAKYGARTSLESRDR